MGAVSRDGTVYSIQEAVVAGPDDPTTQQPTSVPAVVLGVLIAAGTPGEQRVNFMMLQTDYEDLGSPPYNGAVTIQISTP